MLPYPLLSSTACLRRAFVTSILGPLISTAPLFPGRPASAHTSSLQTRSSSTVPQLPDPNNIFLRILNGDAPAAVVDANDEELFTFRDKNPASLIHLLVIPRAFVRDASQLVTADAALVRRMEAKARDLVRKEVGDTFDERELALGFHWPPFYSVPWLHLHAIYPRSRMCRRYKYTSISFRSPASLVEAMSAEEAAGRRGTVPWRPW